MPQQASTLVLVALMVVAFYFLILRPQKKRQQAVQQTMKSLTPGTRVLLGSGIFGTIIAIGDRQAVIEVSPGLDITVLKQAIARIATEADEDAFDDDEEEFDDETDVAADPVVAPEYPQAPAVTNESNPGSSPTSAHYDRDSALDYGRNAAGSSSLAQDPTVQSDRERKSS
jgi:preprotein translocase subunit YajC